MLLSRKTIGIILILASSLLAAIEPVLAKLSFQNADYIQTSTVRAIVIALIAAFYVIFKNRANFKIKFKEIMPLAYLGIVGTILAEVLYMFALTRIPILNAVLIAQMQTVFVVIFGFFLLKTEKLTRYDYWGISLLLIAGILVISKNMHNLVTLKIGSYIEALVLIPSMIWASMTVVVRKYLQATHVGIIAFYRFFLASIILIFYSFFTFNLGISNVYQVLVGLVIGIGLILYYEGLKRLKAAQVGGLELTVPFFAALLGFLILGEDVTIMQLLGMVLLAIGVYFLAKKEAIKSLT